MTEKKVIEEGTFVQDFTLKDQDGNDVRLSDYRGKYVILSFHPLAWTSVCRDQMKELELNHDLFARMDVVPLGLSVDSVPCKSAWAESIELKKLRILSDFWPHGGVADSLGLFREKNGISERANVIVNGEGVVVFVKVYPIKELPDVDEIVNFLKDLTGTVVDANVEIQHCVRTSGGVEACIEDSRAEGINTTPRE